MVSPLLALINALQSRASQIGERLHDAAELFLVDGPWPPLEWAKEFAALLEDSQTARELLLAQAQELGIARGSSPTLDTFAGLRDLAIQVHATRDAQQASLKQIQEAAETLLRAERLRHQRREHFLPLEEVIAQAAALRASTLSPQAHRDVDLIAVCRQVIQGDHPLAALVRLVTETTLTDEDCAALHDVVLRGYGATLAVAAVRGHLICHAAAEDAGMVLGEVAAAPVGAGHGLAPDPAAMEQEPGPVAIAPTALADDASLEPAPSMVALSIASSHPSNEPDEPQPESIMVGPQGGSSLQAEVPPPEVAVVEPDAERLPPLERSPPEVATAEFEAEPLPSRPSWQESKPEVSAVEMEAEPPTASEEPPLAVASLEPEVEPAPLLPDTESPLPAAEIAAPLVVASAPIDSVHGFAATDVYPKSVPATPGAQSDPLPTIDGFASPAPVRTVARPGLTPDLAATEGSAVMVAASALLSEPPERWAEGLTPLLWALLGEGRSGMAYWLSCIQKEHGATVKVPLWLLEAIAFSAVLSSDTGMIAGALAERYRSFDMKLYEGLAADDALAFDFLLGASALTPALLAPHTGAAGILRSILGVERLRLPEPLARVLRSAIDFSDRGHPLVQDVLTNVQDRTTWQAQVSECCEDARRWLDLAPKQTMNYQDASRVWKVWTTRGGVLHELLSPVIEDHTAQLAMVRKCIQDLRDRPRVSALIEKTQRKRIDGNAVEQLRRHLEQALELAARWISLHEREPKAHVDWQISNADLLRAMLEEHGELARRELAGLVASYPGTALGSAARVLERALQGTLALFVRDSDRAAGDPPPGEVLFSELLHVASLRWQAEGEPEGIGAALLDVLRFLTQTAQPDSAAAWRSAFERQSAVHNHQATERILSVVERRAEALGVQPEELDGWRGERAEAVHACQDRLRRELLGLRDDIEKAVLGDILPVDERSLLLNRVEGLERAENLDFRSATAVLSELRERMEGLRRPRVEQARARLSGLAVSPSPEDRLRIEQALERDDLSTAEELLAYAERGEPLPASAGLGPFARFFPDSQRKLDELVTRAKNPADIFRMVRPRGNIGPLSFHGVPPKQLGQSAEVMEVWLTIRREKAARVEHLEVLLRWLGFSLTLRGVTPLPEQRHHDWGWYKVETLVPEGCPVPDFGSSARGVHQLLCVYECPTPDQILEHIGQQSVAQQTLVLYFGCLTEQQRRGLARLSRGRVRRPAVVLDDTLVLWLCGERDSRLPAFFACALPFTSCNPYTPYAAGNLPREMFFGRDGEIASVLDPYGSCFVYGGRQLGKSTLLRHAARKFDHPEHQHHAVYIDLNAEGLGQNRDVDDLWTVMAKFLREREIVPKTMPPNSGLEVFLGHVERWFREQPERRLLLLLDEADILLQTDARGDRNERPFARVLRLKGLMDRTERRFKLVFAGLESVQRFQTIPNQPLAHMGPPISIGPLEPLAARDLVIAPLQSLGYSFASPDLVIRILSHTNYQPSLIQLFCDALLEHLRSRPMDERRSPPYFINEDHIDEVYRKQDLRNRIVERFELTLNLDPRYRALAYSLAWEYTQRGAGKGRSEFAADVQQVEEIARFYWPAGFDGTTAQDIRALLDEMVGLGLLLKDARELYRFRSPNVLRLLGTEEQIERRLQEIERQPPPLGFDPDSFHRTLVAKDLKVRSPLTASQEKDILRLENGVRLIFGSEALGMTDVERSVQRALGDQNGDTDSKDLSVLPWVGVDEAGFQRWLDQEMRERRRGRSVLLVPSSVSFNAGWINHGLEKLQKATSKEKFARLIFLCNPQRAWALLSPPWEARRLIESGAQVVLLRRWNDTALRRYFQDLDISPNDELQRRQIMQRTGGWPTLLQRFAQLQQERRGRWEDALRLLEEELASEGGRDRFLTEVGLRAADSGAVWYVARLLIELGEPSFQDLAELGGSLALEELEGALAFLDHMDLVLHREDRLLFEPVAGQLVKGA